ncbi:MAG TPA: hypothetical protein DFL85_14455 [Lentisphaeria bacterium]|nr:hypothetical protein C5Q97_11920 [Victivallales bacterium CCUG 44730]HBP05956.1 hypothetical protein [Lentisphaeria bacterium]HCH86700.1 hypothetical protein [Lentisphaeria bacterium]
MQKMEDLRNGLLPGRKKEEEPGLFAAEPDQAAEQRQRRNAEPEEPELPPGPIDSEIREVPGAPAKKNTFCRVAGDGSFGSCLAELRQRHNYTIRQLAEETKIREIYLEALEAEDYRNLPQLVYVMGYIRKLCALYGVGKEDADALTAGLRERLQYELPEDISKTVVDHEVSEENERKLRQLILLISGAAVLIVLALVVGGVLILMGLRSSESASSPADPFNENLLVDLQPKPKLEVQELK